MMTSLPEALGMSCPICTAFVEATIDKDKMFQTFETQRPITSHLRELASHAGRTPELLRLRALYCAEAAIWFAVLPVYRVFAGASHSSIVSGARVMNVARSWKGMSDLVLLCDEICDLLTISTTEKALDNSKVTNLIHEDEVHMREILRHARSAALSARRSLRVQQIHYLSAAQSLVAALDAARVPMGQWALIAQDLVTITPSQPLRPWNPKT